MLLCTASLQAQVLSVASGTDFNIAAGTVIGADSLDITPSADFTINGTSLSHNTTASNAVSFPYINSVYQFTNTSNPFTGSLQFVYNNSALNSIPTNYLSLNVHDGSNWNTEPVASLNTGSTYLQTTGLSGVSLNELTLATPPTWTGTTSNSWTNNSNWISNYIPISTSNAVIASGVPNNPVVSTSVVINGLTINSGGNLRVTNSLALTGDINDNGTLSATDGTIVFNGTAIQTINKTSLSNDTIQNLTINNAAGVTLAGPIYVTGTLTPTSGTLNTGGNLTLVSTSAGTARINQGSGSYINGTITAERFITAKTARKYSYIGSPVTATVRNSWQQQIYVSGYGTGGTLCGITTGDGGNTDRYNSNGFDVSLSNSPTIYKYSAATVNGSRYVGIDNTEATNLTPGTGYVVNVRGNRNSATVTCANQFETSTPTPPEAVTLSATGTVSTGSVTANLYDTTLSRFNLLANPYPSQISFTAFSTSNSTNIYKKMWTYSPFGNNNYTTYLDGVIANAANSYDNTSGDYIASGQAFFVQATKAGSAGTVTFEESHKTNGIVPNTQYFGSSANEMIRVGFRTIDSTLLDEVVVRFKPYGLNFYNPNIDAQSFSTANQKLVTLKGNNKLAIATLSDSLAVDTAFLGITSSVNGTFRLLFSDYEAIDANTSIVLLDKFLGVSQDIRAKQAYDFSVTSDTASQGNNRFELVFNAANTLPVSFTSISAAKNNEDAIVKWSIAKEANITSYEVERSNDGANFQPITTKKATGMNSYAVEDASIPANANLLYYRIKAIGTDEIYKFSPVAKLVIRNYESGITVYPNPLKGKTLNISMDNVATGQYFVIISNVLGQRIVEQPINHSGHSATSTLTINTILAAGVYSVSIIDAKSKQLVNRTSLSVQY